jgi:hypothetical protein
MGHKLVTNVLTGIMTKPTFVYDIRQGNISTEHASMNLLIQIIEKLASFDEKNSAKDGFKHDYLLPCI